MPATPDSRLHQILKTNTTISRIIEGTYIVLKIISEHRFKNGDVNGKLEVNGLMRILKNYIKIYMIFMDMFVFH
jgi:hypothetical protein